MITIFKSKTDIADATQLIELNDLFFNTVTSQHLNVESAKKMVLKIDGSKLVGRFQIKSKFNGELLNIDKLSTGCKTALNILFNPEKIFSIKECGDNALDVIYGLEGGIVFSEYPVIPFDFVKVTVSSGGKTREITDYTDLKEWWENEE